MSDIIRQYDARPEPEKLYDKLYDLEPQPGYYY